MKKKIFNFIVLSAFIVSVSMLSIDLFYKNNDKNNYQELKTKIENIDDPYSKLKLENSNYMAWIKIKDTNIDYPVMQTKEDEQYYLYKNFYNAYSPSGTPFLSKNSNIDNGDQLIIYGHNMGNKTMFSDLTLYKDKNYYDTHRIIELITEKGSREYEIFSVFKLNLASKNYFDFYNYTKFINQEKFDEFKMNINSISLYETNINIDINDKILTLVTCDDTGDSNRVVVMAKQINKTEGGKE